MFMVAIDQTVVGIALPTIVAELNGFELYAWVATAYLLTSVITVPIFGRLGDYFGRKPFVMAAIEVFTLASILCGLAQSMLQLVLARAMQGIGGGMLIGTAFACVPDLFPDTHVRLRWQVLMSAAYGVANALGPTLGGFLTQHAGWRSVFFVNIPVGLLGLLAVARFLPSIRPHRVEKIRLDWVGALLIAGGLGCLQLFVEMLPRQGASATTLSWGGVGAALFVALIAWERRCRNPLLPLEMFRNRSVVNLFCLSLFAGFVLFGLMLYVPLLLQGGFRLSPQQAGLLITPLVVFITVGSILNSRIVIRLSRPNDMLYVGYGLLALCCVGVLLSSGRSDTAWFAWPMIVGGLGLGFVIPNLTVFVQETAGRDVLGIAMAMVQSVRMIGGMLGTVVMGTLVTHYYVAGVARAVPQGGGTAWLSTLQDPQVLVNQAVQSDFVAQLLRVGLNGELLLEQARGALVSAVHLGIGAALIVTLLAGVWIMRLPVISLSRRAE
jgi:EmrB/QacA subfamily drug resistance transporter